MPQDALLNAIEEDASAARERMLREAEEAAASIVENARKEAARARDERFAALERELSMQRSAAINRAEIGLEAARLGARKKAVGIVMEKAAERAGGLSGEERRTFIRRLHSELLDLWKEEGDSSPPVVLVNPRDAGLLDGAVEGAEVRADDGVEAGVVFTSGDGRLRFENTVASRLRRGRRDLERLIHGILFG